VRSVAPAGESRRIRGIGGKAIISHGSSSAVPLAMPSPFLLPVTGVAVVDP